MKRKELPIHASLRSDTATMLTMNPSEQIRSNELRTMVMMLAVRTRSD